MKKIILNHFAKTLRSSQTDAEKKLWHCLRDKRLGGIKFKRQQPLGPYIVDFCSFESKVIIELDGGQHAKEAEKEAKRTRYLSERGYKVIRFWDNEVLSSVEAVQEVLLEKLIESPSPWPSPFKGEGNVR